VKLKNEELAEKNKELLKALETIDLKNGEVAELQLALHQMQQNQYVYHL
jgi:hypothetical protein